MSLVQTIARWANRLAERVDRSRGLPIAALLLLYLPVTVVFAQRKLMWNDELYTYYMARLPSMSDVWGALMSRGEQTPPFFYWTTRVAFDLFGVNNLSVRLPEMLGFSVMLVSLYVFVARRASSLSGVCAAAFPLVTTAYSYAFEARPYGLLLGFAALALVSWQSVTMNRRRLVSLVCLAASVAAAVSTQYYGVLVLLPLAFGEGVLSLTRRRLDVAVWAALAVSIVPLALHFPLIRAGAAYSSAFWSPPQWVNVPDFYMDLLTPAIVPTAFILGMGGIYSIVVGSDREAAGRELDACAPAARSCRGLRLHRHAVRLRGPGEGGDRSVRQPLCHSGRHWIAVLAGFGTAASFRRSAAMRLVVAVSLAGWFVLSQAREFIEPTGFSMPVSQAQVNRAIEWLADRDPDLPVVVADPQTFAVLSHYGSREVKSRIVYLADPDLALKHLGHNSVERGMLDLLRPWFRMNVVEFEPYMAAHSPISGVRRLRAAVVSELAICPSSTHAGGAPSSWIEAGTTCSCSRIATRVSHAPPTPRRRPAHRHACRRDSRDRQPQMRSSPRPPGTSGAPSTAEPVSAAARRRTPDAACPAWKRLHRCWSSWCPFCCGCRGRRGRSTCGGMAGCTTSSEPSLAEGKGYRLLNEPGEIAGRAVPASAARRGRRSPAGARDERPDDRRPMASPVVIPRRSWRTVSWRYGSSGRTCRQDVRCWAHCCRCSACMPGSCRTRCSPRSRSASRRCCS